MLNRLFWKKREFSVTYQFGFATIALICFFALYAPISTLVFYSFNAGNNLMLWEGFSFQWYVEASKNELVQEAAIRSLIIAVCASLISTLVATMAALGTTRTAPFKGQKLIFIMINQPLMVPEIVTAVALLIFFAIIKTFTNYYGLGYLITAHAALCVPFVYVPIKARLDGMDLRMVTAAGDLYATPFVVFRRITLPLLWPGILAGAMLSFVISLDDVIITEFVKTAGQDTLPTYMLGQLRRVITPEINAISSVLLAVSLVVVTIFFLFTRKRY